MLQKNKNSNGKPTLWHIGTISRYWKLHEGQCITAGLVLVFAAVLSAQVFVLGKTFVWVDIEPIPSIPWNRLLFSALTYLTLGAILYYLLFYKFLSFVFHGIFNDHRGYIAAKRFVWGVLMIVNYQYVAPFMIGILNKILSFCYNIIALLAFLSPAFGLVITFLLGYALMKRTKSS